MDSLGGLVGGGGGGFERGNFEGEGFFLLFDGVVFLFEAQDLLANLVDLLVGIDLPKHFVLRLSGGPAGAVLQAG